MPSVTFESVDNDYQWGYYFQFKVLIITQNGYINATKLCKDGGKQFKHWLDNQGSKDLINEFESSAGIPAAEVAQMEQTRPGLGRAA